MQPSASITTPLATAALMQTGEARVVPKPAMPATFAGRAGLGRPQCPRRSCLDREGRACGPVLRSSWPPRVPSSGCTAPHATARAPEGRPCTNGSGFARWAVSRRVTVGTGDCQRVRQECLDISFVVIMDHSPHIIVAVPLAKHRGELVGVSTRSEDNCSKMPAMPNLSVIAEVMSRSH